MKEERQITRAGKIQIQGEKNVSFPFVLANKWSMYTVPDLREGVAYRPGKGLHKPVISK